ncbi:MAG: IclR family transcriptional regulator [Actinomycetota bacterium]|nr:IclR family transcriptional regulator [Actinomycetota bacterium]MDQ3732461.1 IclR family transcriptional regulator [Actinomycetota bacterium]
MPQARAVVPEAARVPRYPINSVDNALKLLLMFRNTQVIRVSEASAALEVGRSTAHRLLAMLEYHGFIQQDADTKAYRSGPSLTAIGLAIVHAMDIRAQVRPGLEQLRDELDETVHLMVLQGADVLFLDSVESSRALRTSSRIGRSYPAHTTSGGKALLAELPPERLAELYPDKRLAAGTQRSLKTMDDLTRELRLVRKRGYGSNRGESEPDVAAVAVTVKGSLSRPAAIAVSAPLSRLSEKQEPAIAQAIAAVIDKLSTHL